MRSLALMLRQRHFPRRSFSLKGRSCGLRHSIAVDRCFASSISSAPRGPAASLAELKATAVASADSTLSTCCGLMSRRHSGVLSFEDGDRLTLALDSSASVVGSIADRLSSTATDVMRLILTSVLLPRPLRPCEAHTLNGYSVNETRSARVHEQEGRCLTGRHPLCQNRSRNTWPPNHNTSVWNHVTNKTKPLVSWVELAPRMSHRNPAIV